MSGIIVFIGVFGCACVAFALGYRRGHHVGYLVGGDAAIAAWGDVTRERIRSAQRDLADATRRMSS